jgi:glycosyltransferase involved in cell wall biosynthesis
VRPLRIVQLVETLAVGGLETMAVNLAIAQKRAGHSPSIYTIFAPGALAARAEEAGVPVVPFHKQKGFDPNDIFRIARRLRDDRAQIVHTHNSIVHHYGALAGRLAGVDAVVSTRHGLAFHSGRRPELYYRAVGPLTSATVFVCEAGRRFFVGQGAVPERKTSVILNGIPLQPFQSRRARAGSAPPRIRFGTIGRLVKAKAHTDLVDAFAIIAPELPEAELHLWGDGELRDAVTARIAAANLAGRLHHHGATPDPAGALATLDVFVMSSISEGLPLVILEAMAAGLPVVTTRVGGIPEVAPEGPAAWHCDPGDPRGLADAMRRAAASDLAAAGDTAYAIAAARFGVDTMRERYDALFESLVRGWS